MSKISVEIQGNGSCYVSNPDPPNMTEFTIYAHAAEDEYLIDMYAMSEFMGSVAIDRTTEQTLVYNDEWGHLTIYAEFSGETPPTPPTPTVFDKWWLLFKRDFWRY